MPDKFLGCFLTHIVGWRGVLSIVLQDIYFHLKKFLPNVAMKNVKYTTKMKEFYSFYLYSHHLNSNIEKSYCY